MKNKLLALLATISLVGSASAVKINDNISINGFIDTSWSSTDVNTASVNDDIDLDVDEVELNFLVNAGNVSGELHIDDNDDSGNVGNIEQAHFTYSLDNGLSVQVGRFGSTLGFEREDPAGLYGYTRAYGNLDLSGNFIGASDVNLFDLGNIDAGQSGEGILLGYATDTIGVKVAAFNGIGDLEETSATQNSDDLDYEFSISFTGVENLVLTAGVRSHSASTLDITGGIDADSDITNITAAYTLDKLLLAAEYTTVDIDVAAIDDLSAYLLLADYDINDKMGIAVRYSEWDTGNNTESDKIAIAPNYAITDSLGAILEYSSTENTGGDEADTLALELTFTF
jgi:hypothetical protein